MADPKKSQAAPPDKMVIFTATDAPSLEETGMMEEVTYTVEGADKIPMSDDQSERLVGSSHLTVPFRQQGPGGFSLVEIYFAPGYVLPRHSHSSDCLYYIVEGGIVMGQRELGPGDGFFLPAEQPYAYHAGPNGVKLLEFRHQAAFDMKIYEKDMERYRDKAMRSMGAATANASSS